MAALCKRGVTKTHRSHDEQNFSSIEIDGPGRQRNRLSRQTFLQLLFLMECRVDTGDGGLRAKCTIEWVSEPEY